MDAPTVLYALRWLIYDTFRQALISRVFWILLGCSAICIVFCLGVSVEGGVVKEEGQFWTKSNKELNPETREPGQMSLLFGMMSIPFERTAEREVQFLLGIFASWVAGSIGILMALVWTSGFLPEALQPSAASVLLAKPVPRWLFLAGKYFGVVCFVALHVCIFFLGTWFALGIKTGVWQIEYLLGIPLLVFHFAMIYAFTLILAVVFRSTMACVVGSVLFWLVCYAVNYGRHFAVVSEKIGGPPLSDFTIFIAELGYWLLPKPADWTILLQQSLNLGANMSTLAQEDPFKTVLDNNLFHPILSILSSCLFAAFCLWTSASHLSDTDY